MESEQELWEKACEKAGVWKCNTSLGLCITKNHLHLCPAIGDAEATVKLLEWCMRGDYQVSFAPQSDGSVYVFLGIAWKGGEKGPTLALALAAAVLGVKE